MKPKPQLITHRAVAARLGVETKTLRRWIERGDWPPPVAAVGVTLFYHVEVIDRFIATGRWL